MKRIVRRLLVVLWVMVSAAPVAAQDIKVGVVNAGLILEKAPQAEQAGVKLEEEFAPREKQIRELQDAARSLEEQIKRDGATWSESQRARKERELNRRMRELQREQAAFRDDLNLRRNEELARLQEEIHAVIVELAKREHFDLILSEGAGAVYASERIDITDEVLELMESRAGGE